MKTGNQIQDWNRNALVVVVILISKSCCCASVISASTVEFLPGFQGPLPFQLETGYIGVGESESESDQLFYYFVKSERNAEEDPLILWLTGGPCCSAWSGLVYEVGPLNYKIDPYNGSLPTLLLNPYSWTKVSNIIFVDSPVGTGFSYSKPSSRTKIGDSNQVQSLLQFFKNWLINHSDFISNPLYIAGDSYSGIVVPILVQEISNAIEEGSINVNIKGYILGNPETTSTEVNYQIPFAHGMALISDELYASLERNCGGEYMNVDPTNAKCLKDMDYYDKCISRVQTPYILESKCAFAVLKPRGKTTNKRRWLNDDSISSLPEFGCRTFDQLLSFYWANDLRVQEALHVRKGSKGEWVRCNWNLRDNFYKKEVYNSVPYHANLSTKGFRSLIYSGDHDLKIPFLATQAWIRSLNYSIVDDWRPWFVQTQVAGYARSYSNRMTFATVKGGGHTAPQYKPKECFAMFKRWIENTPL